MAPKRPADAATTGHRGTSKSQKMTPIELPKVDGSTEQAQKVWLDLLPPELRSRIAVHVTRGKENEDSLSLSETTRLQAEAVSSALSYRLHMDTPSFSKYPARWTSLFADNVRTLMLFHMVEKTSGPESNPYPVVLLKAPTLRRAEINDSDAELCAIKNSPSINELLVRIRRKGSHTLLLESLKSLKLSKLELMCCVKEGQDCPYKKSERLNPTPGALATSCPNVTSLQVCCMDYDRCERTWDDENFPFWQLLPTFPALCEVNVEREAPEAVIPTLRGLESVMIKYAPDATQVASELGKPVTMLKTTESLNASEIAQIAKCPRLRELAFYVDAGAEGPLIDVASSTPGLRSLSLEWSTNSARRPRKHKWNVGSRCEVPSGMIFRLVQALPELVALDLYCVRIDLSEVLLALRHMSTRLERFGTSLEDQDETPLDRLESIVMILISHNQSLQRFSFDAEQSLIHGEYHRYLLGPKAAEKQRQQVRRVRRLLRRLQVSAPMLDSYTEHYFDWFFSESNAPVFDLR